MHVVVVVVVVVATLLVSTLVCTVHVSCDTSSELRVVHTVVLYCAHPVQYDECKHACKPLQTARATS